MARRLAVWIITLMVLGALCSSAVLALNFNNGLSGPFVTQIPVLVTAGGSTAPAFLTLGPVPFAQSLVLPLSQTGSFNTTALAFTNTGTGMATTLAINNATSTAATLGISTNGLGPAANFVTTNLQSTSYSLAVTNSGLGRALLIQSTNANNAEPAIDVVTSGSGPAIRASSANGLAADFLGTVRAQNLEVTGTKNFVIDHPLNPMNAVLVHASVESSEMKNLYDGVAVLDRNGEAWVTLPNWFQALNGNFRYQLTAIGGPGPNLYIAQEISNNRFKIAGGRAGLKVSWQVTGVRQDRYAAENPLQVEQPKTPNERGTLLYSGK